MAYLGVKGKSERVWVYLWIGTILLESWGKIKDRLAVPTLNPC